MEVASTAGPLEQKTALLQQPVLTVANTLAGQLVLLQPVVDSKSDTFVGKSTKDIDLVEWAVQWRVEEGFFRSRV